MRLLAPFLLVIAVLVLTIYLDDTPAEADLVFINRGDVFTLDPQRQSYVQDFRMTYALYEGLVRWNNHDFTIEPAAAELPEISADGLTYTFTLFPEVRWSNGQPVTAHDFAYSWMRLLLPETAADYSNLIFCIKGSEAFWTWRNAQLEAFAANPWAADPEERATQTAACCRRLRSLLAADDRPISLSIDASGRRQVEVELDRLERATMEGSAGLTLEQSLKQATAAADLFEQLERQRSSGAESQWMWDEARKRFRETVGIQALGDRVLRVTLERPTAYFLDLVCFGVCSPVYQPCVEGWTETETAARAAEPPWSERRWVSLDALTGRFEQRHQWARPGRLVSNGPYELVEWRYKRDMRLERNPFYHHPERVHCNSVVALTIEDTNTRVLAFESGKLHWLSEVDAEYQADMIAERLAYERRYADRIAACRAEGMSTDEALASLPPPGPGERRNIHVFPTFGTDFYSFNCRKQLSDGSPNPFADPRVRRAFVMSVDKAAIVQTVTRLNEPVATTLIPPGSIPGYRSPRGLPYDLDAARRELADAGWLDRDRDGLIENESGEPFPVIDLLWTTDNPRYKWISLELMSQWEQALGVQIELRGTDTKFYKEDLKQGKFMIARGRWYGDYGDPTTFLDLCKTGDGNNDREFSDPRVDDLLNRAAREPDPSARMQLLEECERILFDEEVPMLPICQLVQVYMYEPGVLEGLSQHPRLTQYLWQMQVNTR